jgi:hypothetical protein
MFTNFCIVSTDSTTQAGKHQCIKRYTGMVTDVRPRMMSSVVLMRTCALNRKSVVTLLVVAR